MFGLVFGFWEIAVFNDSFVEVDARVMFIDADKMFSIFFDVKFVATFIGFGPNWRPVLDLKIYAWEMSFCEVDVFVRSTPGRRRSSSWSG